MRFDDVRAMQWVEAFGFSRAAACPGERRAADVLSDHFIRAGWNVERSETRTGCRRSSVITLGGILLVTLAFSLWRAFRLTLPGLSRTGREVLTLAGLVFLTVLILAAIGSKGIALFRERFLTKHRTPSGERQVNVVASWPREASRNARIVVLSHLDSPSRESAREDWLWVAVMAGLALFVAFCHDRVWAAWGVVGVLVAFLLAGARNWLRSCSASIRDNRSGLAVLAELAESLPDQLHDRIEVRLAAVGGHALGRLGALTLAEESRKHWPAKPTLVVNIDTPGLGRELILYGSGEALEMARSAARELWLPHRQARWPRGGLDHRPFVLTGTPAISLIGDRRAARIDASGLAAAAQLATAIAVRWAEKAVASDQGATAARSTQKPG